MKKSAGLTSPKLKNHPLRTVSISAAGRLLLQICFGLDQQPRRKMTIPTGRGNKETKANRQQTFGCLTRQKKTVICWLVVCKVFLVKKNSNLNCFKKYQQSNTYCNNHFFANIVQKYLCEKKNTLPHKLVALLPRSQMQRGEA